MKQTSQPPVELSLVFKATITLELNPDRSASSETEPRRLIKHLVGQKEAKIGSDDRNHLKVHLAMDPAKAAQIFSDMVRGIEELWNSHSLLLSAGVTVRS